MELCPLKRYTISNGDTKHAKTYEDYTGDRRAEKLAALRRYAFKYELLRPTIPKCYVNCVVLLVNK